MALFDTIRQAGSDLGIGLTPESQESVAAGMANLFAPTAVAGEAVGETLSTVGDYMVPDALGVGESVAKGMEYLGNTTVGRMFAKELVQPTQEYLSTRPELSRFVGNVANTTNLAGTGALLKAPFKMAPKRTQAQAFTEGDMVIEGFYGPKDVKTRFDDFFEQQSTKLKETESPNKWLKLTGNEDYQNAYRFVAGFGDFLRKGSIRAIKSKLSPKSRAIFADYGISEVGIEAAQKYMKAKNAFEAAKEAGKDVKDLRKEMRKQQALAQQQLQATANINTQAGREASSLLSKIAIDAADPDVLTRTGGKPYFKPDRNSNWYNDTVNPEGNPVDNRIFQDHMESAWKLGGDEDVNFIVKKASTKATGKHWEDIMRSDVTMPIADAFAKYGRDVGAKNLAGHTFESNRQLVEYLKPMLEKANAKKKATIDKSVPKGLPAPADKLVRKVAGKKVKTNYSLKFTDPKDIEKYGVWVQGSTAGSAKVEGGVNFLMKVNRDGTIEAMMSDKHDFLEKVAVLGKTIEKKLPETVVATTKPFKYDVYNARPKYFDDIAKTQEQVAKRYETGRKGLQTPELTASVEDTLATVANLKNTVDPASVSREARDMAKRTAAGVAAPTMFSSAIYGDEE